MNDLRNSKNRPKHSTVQDFAVDTTVFSLFSDSLELLKMRYHDYAEELLEDVKKQDTPMAELRKTLKREKQRGEKNEQRK